VVPANDVFAAAGVGGEGLELDHVLVRLRLRVDSRLGPFDWQGEGVHDNERRAARIVRVDLALHQAHHLDLSSAPRVHDHLDQSEGRDADVLEVRWSLCPWLGRQVLLLLCVVVAVDGIALPNLANVVLQLKAFERILRSGSHRGRRRGRHVRCAARDWGVPEESTGARVDVDPS